MKNINPFKFGSIVDDPYFTDRKKELNQVKQVLKSQNHLILISPRRYGKTSLMMKALSQTDRPAIFLNLQLITDVNDFASQLLKRIYRVYPFEHLKQFVKNFRWVPTLSLNPNSNEIEVSFLGAKTAYPPLEDVLNMLEHLGEKGKRPILVLDEFQDILRIGKNLDNQLRATLQQHKNVNYVFLGSMESMMRSIFEKKKSPFYHFGQLMYLERIPEKDFLDYLQKGFENKISEPLGVAKKILAFTQSHPYYTQQLAFEVWEDQPEAHSEIIEKAILKHIQIHDMDYERLWLTQNQTDRKVLIALANKEENILSDSFKQSYGLPATSTVYSSLKRLVKQGYINKVEAHYEIDDPYFAHWIKYNRET